MLDVDALRNYVFGVTKQDGTVEEVPLRAFALVRETSSLGSIHRMNQKRYLSVTATLEEGYNVTLITAKAQDVVGGLDLGDGVSYTFTGENETIMEAVRQLLLMLVLGILLVYLVMVAQFQSLKSPFIVMFTIRCLYRRIYSAAAVRHGDQRHFSHRLRDAHRHHRQQRHRAGGLHQPAPVRRA